MKATVYGSGTSDIIVSRLNKASIVHISLLTSVEVNG